jgi:hypothetical protein
MNLQREHIKLGYEWPIELSPEQREQLLNAKIARAEAWIKSRYPGDVCNNQQEKSNYQHS